MFHFVIISMFPLSYFDREVEKSNLNSLGTWVAQSIARLI